MGSDGDLVMVEVLRRASADNLANSTDGDFSIQHVTQYRYYVDGHADGKNNLLKMVLEPGDVQRVTAAGNTAVDTATKIMTQADTYVVTGGTKTIKYYSSRSFTYYTSDLNTTANVTTPWGTENLETKYGTSASTVSEADSTNSNYMVKSETVRSASSGGCCGGGSAGGVTRSYFYIDINTGTGADTVRRVVIEDSEDATGANQYRKIFGFNSEGHKLREILIQDPTAGTLAAWCESTLLGTGADLNRPTQQRMASAHSLVDTDAEVKKFLNPTASTNDADTLHTAAGLIYVHAYNGSGYRTSTMVKKGSGGTAYFVSATDYGTAADDQPVRLPIATYTYPMQTATKTDGHKTDYVYTFWDVADTQLKTIAVTLAAVPTGENGSNTATTTHQYFDKSGRLRWTKDGEGYVNYFAYHPDTGGLAYTMVDVETDDLPSDITAGSAGKWIEWDDGASGDTIPSGFTRTNNDGRQLVTKTEYDNLGRVTKTTDAKSVVTYTVYGDNQVVVFPVWDTGTSRPLTPIRVAKTDDAGNVLEALTVDPARTASSGSPATPTGLSAGTDQSHYVTWNRMTYNDQNQLESSDAYHEIPSSGTGTLTTNYYRTFNRYDDLGRPIRTIQVVSGTATSSSVEQVTKLVYDVRDRVIEVHQGVSGTGQDMGSTYATDPTLNKVSATYFDEATAGSGTPGVGDGNVTGARKFFGTGGGDYVPTAFHYNWRNHLRGIEPAAGPFFVQDVDDLGRVVATALYDVEPSWAAVFDEPKFAQAVVIQLDPLDQSDCTDVIDDADFAQSIDANRRTLTTTKYDVLGRVYQTAIYEVIQTGMSAGALGDRLVTNHYYDRNSRVVAVYSNGSGGVEYAYDGAGRQYQSRTVTELESTKYASGAFSYSAPLPNQAIASMTGGNDRVLTLNHVVYDAVGNAEQSIRLEANHTDTNGLEIDAGTKDYVQTATFSWYDNAHRLTDTAAYGTGDTNSGAGEWKYFAIPTRPGSAPTRSDEKLVATYVYEAATGRLSTVTDPKAAVSKFIYDDLGRRRYVIENYANFNESTEANTGDGSDTSKDRVTKTVYNGLSQLTTLTALDPDGNGNLSDNQATKYLYEDATHADLTTNIIYPDSADTTSSGTDQVKITYNLDGSAATRLDPRGTVVTFAYDALRRLKAAKVTTNGTGTDVTVKSITRGYDSIGRLAKVTSHGDVTDDPDDASDVQNQVVFEYDDFGMQKKQHQEHDGVKDGGTPVIEYGFDDTATSSVFDKAYRLKHVIYPNARKLHYTYGSSGSIADKLSRLDAIKKDNATNPGDAIATYTFNGGGTFAKKELNTTAGAHAGDTFRLDYYGGTSGTYAGFDRFGRVKDHRWIEYTDAANNGSFADADAFRHQHGYDRASNKQYLEDTLYKSRSAVYTHDGLHRLKEVKAGAISSTKDNVRGMWATDTQKWTLDQLGNQTDVNYFQIVWGTLNYYPLRGDTANSANEITTHKVSGSNAKRMYFDSFSADSSADWEKVDGDDTETRTTANYPSLVQSDVMWVRVTCDGTTLTVSCVKDNSGTPTDTDYDNQGNCYSSTDFDFSGGGGILGIGQGNSKGTIDNFTVKTDRDSNGSYETTELVDLFTANASDMVENALDHDAAGNLTFDGVYQYTYDAWNRLVKVTKAYKDGSNVLQSGSVVNETEYDGLGRRIVRQVKNSGPLDITYRYYHDGDRLVEVRNSTEKVVKQYVWGALYIDELLQVGLNDDPTDTE